MKKRISIDFDGVIHIDPQRRYYNGSIQGELAEGAYDALHRLAHNVHFQPYVLTARTDLENVSSWIFQQTGLHLEVTNQKLPAVVYVDDRGFRFENNWPEVISFIAKLQKD